MAHLIDFNSCPFETVVKNYTSEIDEKHLKISIFSISAFDFLSRAIFGLRECVFHQNSNQVFCLTYLSL